MTDSRKYIDDLRLAHLLADRADDLTMKRFGALDLKVESKPDLTLVSDADKAVEEMLRSQLSTTRSRDSVLGEEGGVTGASPRQWVLDPIDGTHNFVRGVPVWATLIALVDNGDVAVGLVSAPALNRRWWAARGLGAHTGTSLQRSRRIEVSQVGKVDEAFLSYSSLDGWLELGQGRQFLNLQSECWRSRAFGDFWSYMMVAEGVVDIACEPDLELYDMAALVPIVEEAGGRFTSVDGKTSGPWGPNAVATNGLLHEAVVGALAGSD